MNPRKRNYIKLKARERKAAPPAPVVAASTDESAEPETLVEETEVSAPVSTPKRTSKKATGKSTKKSN
tara:strand:- start:406 stop:609 length:204 start_codon:yes stop_codon:yes gene_type:complete